MSQRAVLLVIGAVLGASTAYAQPAHLAADAPHVIEATPPAIDVLTFGVGARIFERWGHAALCLRYHEPAHPTTCFNYGVTNFTEGAPMIWHFLRGEQKFWVEPVALETMYAFYRREDRDIWVQTLPFTGDQARAIEAKLWSDTREENRYYYYDHFLDNCTTRLRDMIDQVAGGALRAGTDVPFPMTFREFGRRGLAEMPPLLVITDFVTGRQLDQHPTLWQAMFHPEVFRDQLELVFGAKPRLLYARKGGAFPIDGPTGRLPALAVAALFALPLLLSRFHRRVVHAVFWPVLGYVVYTLGTVGLVVAVPCALAFLLAHRSRRFALVWAALPLVLGGLIMWSLAVLSSIEGIRWNEVLLVFVPLDLALPFLSLARRRSYARGRIVVLLGVSALAAIGVLHQPLWIPILIALLPLVAIAAQPQPMVATAGDPVPLPGLVREPV